MIDTKDFSFFENKSNFDFKEFLIKIVSYWKWFVISLIITLSIAYQVNIRKQKIYSLDTSIAIKEENNPFFTSNTSLVFNWGGTSDQVQNVSNTLQSRSHNELVVDHLNFFVDYLQQGKYNMQDVYGQIPFNIEFDKDKEQLYQSLITIKFLSDTQYEIKIKFDENSTNLIKYSDNSESKTSVVKGEFVKSYKVGEQVSLPFLHWKLFINNNPGFYKGNEYFVRFNDFDNAVAQYQKITVDASTSAPSILNLSLKGPNKNRIVDYLNSTVKMLIKEQLDRKNLFATNTIAFIDSTLIAMGNDLKQTAEELKAFNRNTSIVDMDGGAATFSTRLADYDVKKDEITRKIAYYNGLKSYLKGSNDYSKLPAPTVAGIDDPNIITNVSKLILLSTQRSEMAYSVKNDRMFKDFDVQMESIKKVLLENINSANTALQFDLSLINNRINEAESNIKKLPEEKQEYLKIVRKYDLSDNIYNTFLQKRSEAEIVKAANLSDIHFIDPAKDIGKGLIGSFNNFGFASFLKKSIVYIVT